MKRKLLVLPWLLYSGLIYILSSHELDKLPKSTILGWDKLLHVVEYSGYSFLAAVAVLSFALPRNRFNLYLVAFLMTLFFGASDEFHQYFIPGRSCSFYDFVADFVGGILGLIIFQKSKLVNKLQHDNTGKTDCK
ncbi:MAG: VanZ family protein [Candidatus Marinimicrobia bacterium]|nr:VanZ family protein [Candidatus Neomarinimicrobiota bacterium]